MFIIVDDPLFVFSPELSLARHLVHCTATLTLRKETIQNELLMALLPLECGLGWCK